MIRSVIIPDPVKLDQWPVDFYHTFTYRNRTFAVGRRVTVDNLVRFTLFLELNNGEDRSFMAMIGVRLNGRGIITTLDHRTEYVRNNKVRFIVVQRALDLIQATIS